eukprot:c20598_g1_i1.p1 GENE.c20598_g1_i1~~c20598_g1_i1.p1  ORF type:complete len:585 (+),score=101.27 c20598_g1_i1:161-1756(+)
MDIESSQLVFNKNYQQHIQALDDHKKRLDSKTEEIKLAKAQIVSRMNGPDKNLQNKSLLTVYVGGRRFQCYRSTLCKVPGSKLEIIFSGRQKIETLPSALADTKEGAYFLDRDPTLFSFVLDALSDDFVEINQAEAESCGTTKEQVALELNYFGLACSPVATTAAFPIRPTTEVSSSLKHSFCNALDKCLAAREEALITAENDLKLLSGKITQEIQLVDQTNQHTKDAIRINVRGEKFLTTRSTLCAGGPGCMLTPIFASCSRHTIAKDDDGDPFLDRNGRRFGPILNLLRLFRDCPELASASQNSGNFNISSDIRQQLEFLVGSFAKLEMDQLGIEVPLQSLFIFHSSIVNGDMKNTLSKMFNGNVPCEIRLIYSYDENNYPQTNPYLSTGGPTLTLIQSNSNHVFGVFLAEEIETPDSWFNTNPHSFLFGLGNITKVPLKILSAQGGGSVLVSGSGLYVGQNNELQLFVQGQWQQEYCYAGHSAGCDWTIIAPGYGPISPNEGILCGTPGTPTYLPSKVEVFAVKWNAQ